MGAAAVNPYVKLSYHQIFVPLQFTIPLTPFHLPFSFNGYSAIPGNELADRVIKEAITIATNTILSVSFSSSMRVMSDTTIYQNTNASHKFTNTKRLLETLNRSRSEKMTYCLLDYDSTTKMSVMPPR